ncbi:GlsB/YeaQ/YmgE family stress response membrane protein [Streptomyces sp. NPDC048270]|uniref:GlsB/YeaQ/YmgE family stress response membrane protein n=1 Tax=Streptomyces sp. NPDC048270 TaxID=3154615 RepID=UPI0033C807AF
MHISSILSAVLIGVAIGVLGRLAVPGRQHIGVLWTLTVGIAAALAGTALAGVLGVADTRGVDWAEWLAQIALAAAGVWALSRAKGFR